ncbi:hypothetical protein SS50377_20376 [Spironucleus salmonicida]|uniref:Uncharacterized protein n=1 Tax=Spironucleus salmonicida TaxID=348837 RepID=V6LEU8_9EUKA|nr:hypothetical protein SS50377_20376 [Spironucleus salmonicida]|eukprot:EST43055.1 Hypothetical protein SS50377_17358 [Spironucleus salmonicida]
MSKYSVTIDETMDKSILQDLKFEEQNNHLVTKSDKYQLIEIKRQQQTFLSNSMKDKKVKRSYIISCIFEEVVPDIKYSIPNLPSSNWTQNLQAYNK